MGLRDIIKCMGKCCVLHHFVALDFTFGTLVCQDRKFSFAFRRESDEDENSSEVSGALRNDETDIPHTKTPQISISGTSNEGKETPASVESARRDEEAHAEICGQEVNEAHYVDPKLVSASIKRAVHEEAYDRYIKNMHDIIHSEAEHLSKTKKIYANEGDIKRREERFRTTRDREHLRMQISERNDKRAQQNKEMKNAVAALPLDTPYSKMSNRIVKLTLMTTEYTSEADG